MRPWLRWLLVLSAIASAAALWWPENVVRAVARTEAAVTGAQLETSLQTGSSQPMSAEAAVALPERLQAAVLEKSAFDPFLGLQPPPPPPPAPVPVTVVAPPPPPAPTAPPLTYRYLGQMIDPSGKRFVYLGKADKDVSVAVGMQLDEGYVVEAITNSAVEVRYPPLDVRAVIAIPPTTDTAVR